MSDIQKVIEDFNKRWFDWVEKHDAKQTEFERRVFERLEKTAIDLGTFMSANAEKVKKIDVIEEKQDIHDRIITQTEVYLKNILEELKAVNLAVLKKDVDALHHKVRETDGKVENFQKEIEGVVKEVKEDIVALEKAAGKFAIRVWLWVGSIAATATVTALITTIVQKLTGG